MLAKNKLACRVVDGAINLPLDKSIELCKMSIYFNNINGYLNKRSNFLNNKIAKDFNVLILQETNVKDCHKFYDDFSYVNKLGANVHLCDNSYYSRGTIFAWDPKFVSADILKKHTQNFEIGVVKLTSKIDTITVVSAYRSPSMINEPGKTEQFFDTLHEILGEINGKIILVGDLNLQRGRKLHHRSGEEFYLNQISSVGLKSIAKGVTHPSKNNQLDYCFTNIEDGISCDIVDGFASDHCAFNIQVDIRLKKIEMPAIYVLKWQEIDMSAITRLIDVNVTKIIQADMPIGRAIIEYEMLLWDIQEDIIAKRYIKPHTRLENCSRQVSATILNTNINDSEKRKRLASNLKKDAARKLGKSLSDGSVGARLMASFNLGAKGKQILTCNIDPNKFLGEIVDDERKVNHADHDTEKFRGKWKNLLKKFPDDQIDHAMSKLLKKWRMKETFSEPFWRHVARKIGSDLDFGVYTFSYVETVLKKIDKVDTTKGWRLVWKASSMCEKLYDLLKAMSMDVTELNNDAYCVDRSTQKTLAKVCTWPVSVGEVFLGCDYQNAFALACRPCINTLLDCEYLNPEIHFQVVTDRLCDWRAWIQSAV